MELPFQLTFATLGLKVAFAYINARVTTRQLREGKFKQSTLCATSSHWKSTPADTQG